MYEEQKNLCGRNAQYNLSLKEAVDICKKIRGIVPLGSGTYTAHHEGLDPVDGRGNPMAGLCVRNADCRGCS